MLLVRSALHHDAKGSRTPTTVPTQTQTHKRVPLKDRVYYRIRAGDTLEFVATKFNTTTHQLLLWNPGIDPHSLRPGQRIRVK